MESLFEDIEKNDVVFNSSEDDLKMFCLVTEQELTPNLTKRMLRLSDEEWLADQEQLRLLKSRGPIIFDYLRRRYGKKEAKNERSHKKEG